jgi:hypothetical protein
MNQDILRSPLFLCDSPVARITKTQLIVLYFECRWGCIDAFKNQASAIETYKYLVAKISLETKSSRKWFSAKPSIHCI